MAVSSKDISQERTPVADYRAPQATAAKLTPEPVEVTDGRPAQSERGATLRTIVELVRRTMHADTTSVVSFSLAEKTITWQAASGFHSYPVDEQNKLVRPIN